MTLPILQTDVPPGFIDLGSGNPGLDLLPMEMIAAAADHYFSIGDRRTLQYGAEQGNGLFLSALADFLTNRYGFSVKPENLFTTAGASSALDLLCTLMTRPGDSIIVEEPTYFLALRVFADHHLKVHAVPMDHDGLDLDALEKMLFEINPRFVYTIPSFHNPASTTLSLGRRERLVQLAQENDFILIADEVYHFLGYNKQPPGPIAQFSDEVEQVVSINSFSKILAPGLRLGWVQSHPKVINRLMKCGLLDSGGGLNPFTSAVVYHLIEKGELTKNIHHLHDVYARRREVMASALKRFLPEVEYQEPQGGYYFWVRIPGRECGKLRGVAQKHKIDFRPGVLFSSRGELRDQIRLSVSYHTSNEIKAGIKLLGQVLQES